ncbi:MAG: ABC transporter permease, partial [Patescibacteria group bacterium]
MVFHEFYISTKLAIKNLKSNWGRTLLSLSGIVLGVMSVIVVLSVGNGVKGYVVGQIESFGSDIMQIEVKVPKTSKTSSDNAGGMVGGTQITTLKISDIEEVAKIRNVGAWYAGIMNQQVASFESQNKQVFVMGVSSGVTEADKQTKVAKGRMFSDEEDDSLKQVVVLGSKTKEDFFGNLEAVGKKIKIKNQNFEIIGVLEERGSTGFFNFDETVYMPIQTLQKRVMGIDYVQFAVFKIRDMEKLPATIAEATDVMREEHDIDNPDDDDFAVNSIVELREILDKVFYTINLLLLALTSISLVVGGVGIMNVMYVAVAERTFEIGLRKAIGARNRDILRQFLLEAIFLTVAGGIMGILLGLLASWSISYVINQFGLFFSLSVSWDSLLIGFGFSALAGIVFGFYPARKASHLTPM